MLGLSSYRLPDLRNRVAVCRWQESPNYEWWHVGSCTGDAAGALRWQALGRDSQFLLRVVCTRCAEMPGELLIFSVGERG